MTRIEVTVGCNSVDHFCAREGRATPVLEFVVILVRADPDPLDGIIKPLSDSAVVIADTDRESLSGTTL
jgi:hypothetical protein